jgi:pantoate--beta-alanine ligase
MSPVVISTAGELRSACDQVRLRGHRVAFVPTMGALHSGHLALVAVAKSRAPMVVVSIFVNPTQFAAGEDFARYPRRVEDDLRRLAGVGAARSQDGASDVCVFVPAVDEIYPPGEQTRVRVGALAEPLCGRFRLGHFEGVATVVAKLLALVGPCDAVFGRKDYQQLLVIRRMVQDLLLPVTIVDHPTMRERDGLALSSRNVYLSKDERTRALSLVRGIDDAARRFAVGERSARELERLAREPLEASGARVDYVELRDAETLAEIPGNVGERGVLAVACWFGPTRLIDNIVLGQDQPPLSSAGF